MQELRITPEDAQDRTGWKSRIRAADPHLVGKGEEEEKEVEKKKKKRRQ